MNADLKKKITDQIKIAEELTSEIPETVTNKAAYCVGVMQQVLKTIAESVDTTFTKPKL